MLNELIEIIKDKVDIDSAIITEDTVLLSDLGLNSLDLIELVCDVEERFDIEIPDREIKNLKTVGDVILYIEENR